MSLEIDLAPIHLHLKLAPELVNALEEVSRPKLNFPYDFVRNAGPFGYGGATIEGQSFAANPLAPQTDAERY